MRRPLVVLLILPILLLTGLAVMPGDSPSQARPMRPEVTPWPTWTPMPTPIRPRLVREAEPVLPDHADAFPFETCVDTWCEEYYNAYDQGGPIGPLVNARRSHEIDYYWGLGSPMSGVNTDNFAARYRHRVHFYTPGIYHFYIYHDDGVKVLINNVSIFGDSLWGDIGPAVPSFNDFRYPVNGDQDLDIEILYFEDKGVAALKFWWWFEPSCQSDPTGQDCRQYPNFFSGWRGEYYNSANYPTSWPSGTSPLWPVNLYNNLTLIRDDRTSGPDYPGQPGDGLYFDWGLGSPAGGINAGEFSASWTRAVQFSGGFYRFYLRVDDGGRLAIDGNVVLDQWRVQGDFHSATTYSYDTYLTPGPHVIRADLQQLGGTSTIRLWWENR